VTAETIFVGHPLIIEDLSRLVGLMTIHAGGQNVLLLFPQFPLDDLAVDLLDLSMTRGARVRDIRSGNR